MARGRARDEEMVVGMATKVLREALRRWQSASVEMHSSAGGAESAKESLQAGLLKSWLKGITLGRDSAQGAVATIFIGPHLEARFEEICKDFQRTTVRHSMWTCKVARTSGGSHAQFIWSSAPESPEALVRSGYPIEVAEVLATAFHLKTIDLLAAVGVPARTAARRVSDDKLLKSEESDRLFRAGDVMFRALEIFGDLNRAREFLTTPNPSLNGATPLSLLDTVPGRDRVIGLLGQIEHGVYA